MGNKQRFLNNANKKYTNCYPKNLFCNTVFRIALYASTDIKAGTELFFDYSYPAEWTANFKQPKIKEIVVVKQKHKSKSATPSVKSTSSSTTTHRRKALNYNTSSDQHVRVAQLRSRLRNMARRSETRDSSNTTDSQTEIASRNLSVDYCAESQGTHDTDENRDDDLVIGDSQETDDIDDISVSNQEDATLEGLGETTSRRFPDRSRRMSRTAPVVAVETRRNSLRSAVSILGKRKRSDVFDNDDK